MAREGNGPVSCREGKERGRGEWRRDLPAVLCLCCETRIEGLKSRWWAEHDARFEEKRRHHGSYG